MWLASVGFDASATDAEDGALGMTWTSSLDGVLNSGLTRDRFFRNNLSQGQHMLKVSATDSAGNTTSETITLNVINDAPELTILNPTDGSSFLASQAISLVGQSYDKNDPGQTLRDDQVNWEVVGFRAAGHTAEIPAGTPTPGVHSLTFAGTDGQTEDTEIVQITILEEPEDNTAPTAVISSPSDGHDVYSYRVRH